MNECQICDPLQMLEDVRVQRDAHHRELVRLRAQHGFVTNHWLTSPTELAAKTHSRSLT